MSEIRTWQSHTVYYRESIMNLRRFVMVISVVSLAITSPLPVPTQSFIDSSFDKYFEDFGSVAFRRPELDRGTITQQVKNSPEQQQRYDLIMKVITNHVDVILFL